MLPGWWCCHVLVLFSLQSRQQGLPQWILSHFRQAPPLTDHTAAFKSLSEHQRQLCDFAFLSEHYNLWSVPPLMKSPAPLAPTAIFNDFPKTHSGFSGTVHHSGRVKWDPPPPLSFLALHDARVPPVGKWRVVWIRRQGARAWDNGTGCINDSVAGCSAQNIIYSSHWREITGAIFSRSRKISWPGNTLRGARRRVRHYNYYIASPYSLSVSILLT